MTSEELAQQVSDQMADVGGQSTPVSTTVDTSAFDLDMPDGTRAIVTVEVVHRG